MDAFLIFVVFIKVPRPKSSDNLVVKIWNFFVYEDGL